ncbi:unnamed protein product [Brassica oleracea]
MDFGLIRFHKYKSSDITLVLKKIMPRHQSKYSPDQLYNRQNPANDNTLFFFSLNLTSTTVDCHRRNECRHLTMIPYATIEEATCFFFFLKKGFHIKKNHDRGGHASLSLESSSIQEATCSVVILLQRRHEDVHPRRWPFTTRVSSFDPGKKSRSLSDEFGTAVVYDFPCTLTK